jgi:hypothetical protein
LTPLFNEGMKCPLSSLYSNWHGARLTSHVRFLDFSGTLLRQKPWTCPSGARRGYSKLGDQHRRVSDIVRYCCSNARGLIVCKGLLSDPSS